MHHTCGALRTMRSMQRTPHIVRRLMLGVQHATCGVQNATRSVQRTACTPPYPNSSDAATNTAPKRTKLALRSIQRATRNAQAYTVHHATCNAQRPGATWTLPLAAKTGVMQPATYNHATQRCNTSAHHATSNIRASCAAHVATCHHTPCHVQRTPCHFMQHAQLSATRIAHRKRACDAAALELD